jgi:hypothetical protein
METSFNYSSTFIFVLGVLGWTIWYARKAITSHPAIKWTSELLVSLGIGLPVGVALGGLSYLATGISNMDSSLRLTRYDLIVAITAWSCICTSLCFALVLKEKSSKSSQQGPIAR